MFDVNLDSNEEYNNDPTTSKYSNNNNDNLDEPHSLSLVRQTKSFFGGFFVLQFLVIITLLNILQITLTFNILINKFFYTLSKSIIFQVNLLSSSKNHTNMILKV